VFKSLLARAREARAAELEGEEGYEAGFTLIELMVVLLIIAILLAIAIPTFLGVTGSAKDRASQSTLTNVLTETVAQYQNTQAYPALSDGTNFCFSATAATGCFTGAGAAGAEFNTATNYSATDPQFTWANGYLSAQKCTVASASKCVSVAPVDVASGLDMQGVVLSVMSSTGTCWYVVNMQTNPAAIASDTGTNANTSNAAITGTPFTAAAGAATAGTFYAQVLSTSAKAGNCYAAYGSSGLNWGSSYATAPQN
jgi:prepilin-type N-terminal cleavage/methylation domain-containing protein